MKIEKSTVTKLTITDIMGDPHRLDPITVFLEDLEPRKGRITIRCYDKAWTAYWGGMGEQTVAQFFRSCDEHYIAKNLEQGIDSDIVDSDSIKDGAFREIVASRRGRLRRDWRNSERMVRYGREEISADLARELWDEVEETEFSSDGWGESDLMQRVFGDEWWCRLPTKPNPAYQYLCRIIKAVQEALRQIEQAVPEPA